MRFTIIRLEVALLLAYVKTAFYFIFFFLLCTKNFSGLDFHSTGRTLFRRTGHMSEELRCTSSLFLTPTQKPFQKPQKKVLQEKCNKHIPTTYFKQSPHILLSRPFVVGLVVKLPQWNEDLLCFFSFPT